MRYADTLQDLFTYNVGGQMTSMADANSNFISRGYDHLGRLTTVDVTPGPGIIGTTRQEFTYDPMGHRTQAKDLSGTSDVQTTTFRYDSLGHQFLETQNGIIVNATLDGLGNRLLIQYPNGAAVTSTFDALARVGALHSESGQYLASYQWCAPLSLAHFCLKIPLHFGSLLDKTHAVFSIPGVRAA